MSDQPVNDQLDLGQPMVGAGARPMVDMVAGKAVAAIHEDRYEVPWEPGTYRVSVLCAGEGQVAVQVAIGDVVTTMTTMPACVTAGAVGTVEVTVDAGRAGGTHPGSAVTIVPVGLPLAASAYRIDKIA